MKEVVPPNCPGSRSIAAEPRPGDVACIFASAGISGPFPRTRTRPCSLFFVSVREKKARSIQEASVISTSESDRGLREATIDMKSVNLSRRKGNIASRSCQRQPRKPILSTTDSDSWQTLQLVTCIRTVQSNEYLGRRSA
ncbi:uncharacterized protein PV06_00578 [Exophiala oligosperma]|uniref:Uncharacterized protein n=1 Tax=Exophiala oligosperma TaxID=215243 RepID=A0A0D2EJ29_9EURO|nr:uncharacterized protein PV06_00578 [Exophiala oligosperma]KIW47929.1 hypothetical protein PV06_00578 [Exophiala oligosperma]